MRILYNLPHVFDGHGSARENAAVLHVLVDTLVRINRIYVRHHTVKPLYRSGVVYGRTLWWEPIPAVYERGFADCKSLSAIKIVELENEGIECRPVFRFMPRPDGGADYHILIQTPQGFHDPSKVLGMGENEWSRFYDPGYVEV